MNYQWYQLVFDGAIATNLVGHALHLPAIVFSPSSIATRSRLQEEVLLVLSSSNSLNRGVACARLARADHPASKAHNQTTTIKSKREKVIVWDRELSKHGNFLLENQSTRFSQKRWFRLCERRLGQCVRSTADGAKGEPTS